MRDHLSFRLFLAFGLATFIFLNVFALSSFSIPTDATYDMAGCPLMGMTAICQTNPIGHIRAWQDMFTTTATRTASNFALALLAVYLIILFTKQGIYLEIRAPVRYRRRDSSAFFISPLQEAFSNGILHSKVF